MKFKTRLQSLALVALCTLGFAGAAYAQDSASAAPAASASVAAPAAAEAVAAPAAAVAAPNNGDVAWMLTSTLLVLLMAVPALALFYGGMVRAKNVLSVLAQVTVVFSLIGILWALYGYSLAFTGSGSFVGSLEKAFLKGVTPDSVTSGLPEYLYIAFQLTFAAITGALIVGAFAERAKFAAVVLFSVLWFTFGYAPLAHIVWGGGFLASKHALDFAGGTVVHLNAGVAGLVGAILIGKRTGFGKEVIKPHNVVLTYIGSMLLWVGWFGFNAGSALVAGSVASLAFLNTLLATAAALLAWGAAEKITKGKPSVLGISSGAVAGLVAITPACGTVGPLGAIVIGIAAGVVCLWGVTGLKKLIGADDSLDVFGVHGVGGALGAILTGVFTAPSLGGTGYAEGMTLGSQVVVQIESVLFTIVLIGVVSVVAFLIAKAVFGLRVSEDAEREGLDITSHGESAYEG